MLSVQKLQASYGPSQVLFDVELRIGEGEVVTLLGRNGMGKTTTIRAIMGLLRPKAGEVEFAGARVAGWTPEAIARRGIGLVPKAGRCSRP
jgi:branched-chain amino acid transport system ATP-binding protein